MSPYLLASILLLVFIGIILGWRLLHLKLSTLFSGIIGVIVGLLIGYLLNSPLSKLPDPYNEWIPLATSITLAVVFGFVFVFQKDRMADRFMRFLQRTIVLLKKPPEFLGIPMEKKPTVPEEKRGGILVDTSVLIDGRIEDIVKTGFITEKLIVHHFVLEELQKVADSEDILKRNRGRRGLEILKHLQKETEVELLEEDFPKLKGVDAKLVKSAKEHGAMILTTDYNLNKVAGIRGVKVLNINELVNALKTVILPGESMTIKVIQEGKEKDQGVGYLEDGTMVVVEGGNNMIGDTVETEVMRVFQTAAGRMIFVQPKK